MSFYFTMFGMRAWPTPFLRPMWPFMVGGAMTFYLVAKAQAGMIAVEPYKSDPKNPHRVPVAAH
ncbi:hypothetical protein B0A53_06423 [Rhodotorula sp. CCFEE 5036]|nr:hypothetical protein B0A53_06423 [Rhodotorula sp. CCFEE 5036]